MKFPIRIPLGTKLTLVQPFHTASPVDISQALKIQTTDHLGVDVTLDTDQQTWGKECVWPFLTPGDVYDAEVDSTFGAKLHAHTQINTKDPQTGIEYGLIFLHLSSVPQTKKDGDTNVITYVQGDTVGRIGNNGYVNPPPTQLQPLLGTHLHLGLGVKNPGDLNFIMVDPLLYFDLTDPFYINPQVQNDSQVIKDEITVLNQQTDPVVRKSFIDLIVSQVKKLLGINSP